MGFSMAFFRRLPLKYVFQGHFSGGMGVPVLCPCPSIGGWILHLSLFGTISVNDMAWAREGQCLDKHLDGWMFGMS